jgi:hypothetical protein
VVSITNGPIPVFDERFICGLIVVELTKLMHADSARRKTQQPRALTHHTEFVDRDKVKVKVGVTDI